VLSHACKTTLRCVTLYPLPFAPAPGWYYAVFDLALSPTGDTLIYQANRNLEHPVTTVHPEPCSLL
jgi:hypothetical protein